MLPEVCRHGLEELRRVHGDRWVIENQRTLEAQLDDILNF
jgi:hypothetical protein